MHGSIIHALPSPTCIAHNSAIILHVYYARYDPPTPPPLCVCHTLYNIDNAITCKGQPFGLVRPSRMRRGRVYEESAAKPVRD